MVDSNRRDSIDTTIRFFSAKVLFKNTVEWLVRLSCIELSCFDSTDDQWWWSLKRLYMRFQGFELMLMEVNVYFLSTYTAFPN